MEREKAYKGSISVDSIVAVLFALGLYTKEFYIMASGSLQIGDMLLLGAFLLCFFYGKIYLQQIDSPLFLFFFAAVGINFIYYLRFDDISFLKYSMYLVFSVITVLLIRNNLYNDMLLKYTSFALKAALITQILVRLLGFGRLFFGRYSGTFNDPNQFGYYVFMCILIIYTVDFLRRQEFHILWIVVSGYLIALSQSSGMLVGFAVFLLLFAWKMTGALQSSVRYIIRFVVVFLLVIAILMLFTTGDLSLLGAYHGRFSGLRRLLNKLSSGSTVSDFINFYLRDRSLTRVIENPSGLMYGTGEGMWSRYTTNNEIHATMVSLCFYYGIFPYICWVLWIKNNLRSLHPALFCVYVAHIAEAFTLANHRQPFFWMLFVLAASPLCKNDEISSDFEEEKHLLWR